MPLFFIFCVRLLRSKCEPNQEGFTISPQRLPITQAIPKVEKRHYLKECNDNSNGCNNIDSNVKNFVLALFVKLIVPF